MRLVGVVKSLQMIPTLVTLFQEAGIEALGISDVDIHTRLGKPLDGEPMLIKIPKPSQADTIVRNFRASLGSELVTIRALSEAAHRQRVTHELTLMIELGDLREGVLPGNALRHVREILEFSSPYLRLVGLGANLACCHGTLPSVENLAVLDEIATEAERRLGHRFDKVSVGGSVMLDWLEKHAAPPRINELRVGEAIVLGTIPGSDRRHPALLQDAFVLKGTVVEVKDKATAPLPEAGTAGRGREPLGRAVPGKRAIVDLGYINTVPRGLKCMDEHVRHVCSTSDYSVFDVTDCPRQLAPGDEIEFIPDYRAMTQSLMSPYVAREIV